MIQPQKVTVERSFFAQRFTYDRYAARDLCAAISSQFPEFSTRYTVNIGAGDGVSSNDPTFPLFMSGHGGLAIEGLASDELMRNIPQENVKKITNFFVDPENIIELFASQNVPVSPDFLKLDIDGFDGDILMSILNRGYRPKIVQIEINAEIPPPISFCVHWNKDYRIVDDGGNISGFYGMSMQYANNLMSYFGYTLIDIDFVQGGHDLVFCHNLYISALGGIAHRYCGKSMREIFNEHPPSWPHFREYGHDSVQWRNINDVARLAEEVWQACIDCNRRKHNGRVLPFHFGIHSFGRP